MKAHEWNWDRFGTSQLTIASLPKLQQNHSTLRSGPGDSNPSGPLEGGEERLRPRRWSGVRQPPLFINSASALRDDTCDVTDDSSGNAGVTAWGRSYCSRDQSIVGGGGVLFSPPEHEVAAQGSHEKAKQRTDTSSR
ncbi:hypothetical protein EYF80_005590 [Liparis tanakae]|uniref:Uncharacterized protein n=1 Tax=Liparis tanakae TaxID=230148 RepID=A0A4Z2J445_9TELE|nr:hypothetical protein EYF80_005590 [Liparis tanakae]